MRQDINILWLDIDILRPDINILRPDINILRLDINFSDLSPLTGVSSGIYYEGIYMVKVILKEIYMLEYFMKFLDALASLELDL